MVTTQHMQQERRKVFFSHMPARWRQAMLYRRCKQATGKAAFKGPPTENPLTDEHQI
jgi:hypothetical protein